MHMHEGHYDECSIYNLCNISESVPVHMSELTEVGVVASCEIKR